MKILHLNEGLYDSVIAQLQKNGNTQHANLLIKLKEQARVDPALADVTSERADGELSDEQKECLRTMHSGGSLRSLRWNNVVFCCVYYEGTAKNIEPGEVESLLKKGIIQGISQTVFPDKEYVFTDFGKTVKV